MNQTISLTCLTFFWLYSCSHTWLTDVAEASHILSSAHAYSAVTLIKLRVSDSFAFAIFTPDYPRILNLSIHARDDHGQVHRKCREAIGTLVVAASFYLCYGATPFNILLRLPQYFLVQTKIPIILIEHLLIRSCIIVAIWVFFTK